MATQQLPAQMYSGVKSIELALKGCQVLTRGLRWAVYGVVEKRDRTARWRQLHWESTDKADSA